MLVSKLRQRTGREEGFTLIELLVVLIIIGVLLAIAVPSYLAFKDRAEKRAAQSNVRAAVPSVEVYYADSSEDFPTGTVHVDYGDASYIGLSTTALQTRDAALKLDSASGTQDTYCISSHVGNWFASKGGPAEPILAVRTTADPCVAGP